ncbi:MAG: hypothetical protein IPK61_14860 [Saprospiraceae bacterium]|nr:hypothetical protein [Saprospiraceae bacterium]
MIEERIKSKQQKLDELLKTKTKLDKESEKAKQWEIKKAEKQEQQSEDPRRAGKRSNQKSQKISIQQRQL